MESLELGFLFTQKIVDLSLLGSFPDILFKIGPGPGPFVVNQDGKLGEVCPGAAVENINAFMPFARGAGVEVSLELGEGRLGRLL